MRYRPGRSLFGLVLALAVWTQADPAFARGPQSPGSQFPGSQFLGLQPPADARDADAVPYVTDQCRGIYRQYLDAPDHKAFVLTRTGACYAATRQASAAEAEAKALEACRKATPAPCFPYARNGQLVRGDLYRLTVGSLRSDPDYPILGPIHAKGVLVWAHGKGSRGDGRPADYRANPLPPIARAFAAAGWDVFRHDRDPAADTLPPGNNAFIEGLESLKVLGYGRVIAGGQSFGGWMALNMLTRTPVVDGVLALAPAVHGTDFTEEKRQQALKDFAAILLQPPRAKAGRVVVALFAEDPFDPDLDARAKGLTDHFAGAKLPLLLLARPSGLSGQALSGHTAGVGQPFADRYAPCILAFFEGAATGC